jgi:hypothetical protein
VNKEKQSQNDRETRINLAMTLTNRIRSEAEFWIDMVDEKIKNPHEITKIELSEEALDDFVKTTGWSKNKAKRALNIGLGISEGDFVFDPKIDLNKKPNS